MSPTSSRNKVPSCANSNLPRRIATAPGYDFSDALRAMDIVWSARTISRLFEVVGWERPWDVSDERDLPTLP